jgi:hypothetical protein
MTDLLEKQLESIHAQNQPDDIFAHQLEQQLKAIHKPVQHTTFPRRLAAVAASVLLLVGAFITVPPLRSMAEDVFDFFITGTTYRLAGEESAYMDVVMVNTVEEAEAIAGFEALEWVEGGFNILSISAGEGYIHITYERDNDRGVLMHITKWHTATRPEQHPIDASAQVEATTINGVDAQFVRGSFFGEEPNLEWVADYYRQLRWQANGFSYRLMISWPVVQTLEQTVAIAESLQ